MRVYSRVGTEAHVRAVKEAFDEWVRRRFQGKVVASTPCKPLLPARNGAGTAVAVAAAAAAAAGNGRQAAKRGRSLFGDAASPPLPGSKARTE